MVLFGEIIGLVIVGIMGFMAYTTIRPTKTEDKITISDIKQNIVNSRD